MNEDVYLKKVIDLKYRGKTLRFSVSQDLFSSFQVDVGTRFLLRTVMPAGTHSFEKVLDLGCGYGPLGLALRGGDEKAIVHMVDRDALAVEFSRLNAGLNGLTDVQIYGSLGYDDVCETDYDLIISNIPGKAGEPVITHFLRDARYFLKPGGLVAVVVVAAIEPVVAGILDNTPDIDIAFHEARSGHAVFHYRFAGMPGKYENAFDRGVYDRTEMSFQHHDTTYPMRTARGLPEFDSLHYRTELLLDGLRQTRRRNADRSVVINPGQGYAPVVLWHLIQPDNITLIDRDLLALRYSQRNLSLNDCPAENVTMKHAVGFSMNEGEQADLIVGVLREEEGPTAVFETAKKAAGFLAHDGVMLLAAGSTAATRLVEMLSSEDRLEVVDKRKRRGYCLLKLQPG
jgi:16S rRNA (guanine1207-N2)-methyltransferase